MTVYQIRFWNAICQISLLLLFPVPLCCFQLQNNIVETQIIFVTPLLSQEILYLDFERKIEIKNRNEFDDDDGWFFWVERVVTLPQFLLITFRSALQLETKPLSFFSFFFVLLTTSFCSKCTSRNLFCILIRFSLLSPFCLSSFYLVFTSVRIIVLHSQCMFCNLCLPILV